MFPSASFTAVGVAGEAGIDGGSCHGSSRGGGGARGGGEDGGEHGRVVDLVGLIGEEVNYRNKPLFQDRFMKKKKPKDSPV